MNFLIISFFVLSFSFLSPVYGDNSTESIINMIEQFQKFSVDEHKNLIIKLDEIESSSIKQQDFQNNLNELESKLDSNRDIVIAKIIDTDEKNKSQYNLGIILGTTGIVMSLIVAGLAVKKADKNNKEL